MLLNVIFDIILISILAIGAVYGIKKGFVKAVAKPVKFIAAIVISLSLAGILSSTVIEPIIGPAISNKLSDTLIEKYSNVTVDNANDELPTLVKIAAGACGLDVSDIADKSDSENVIVEIAESVTAPIVGLIGSILGFVILYFVSKILLGMLISFLNTLIDRGVVKFLNRTLGCVFSVFMAFVAVWCVTVIFEFLFNIPVIANIGFIDNFTGGPIYRFFKSFTPLDLLLSF